MRKHDVLFMLGFSLLIACGDESRNIIIKNECTDMLPDYVFGEYWLIELEIYDTLRNKKTTLTSKNVWGRLSLHPDGLFKREIKIFTERESIEGYYDVLSNVMFIYNTIEYKDISMIYQYNYNRKYFILESFNGRTKRRYKTTWEKLPFDNGGSNI